MENKKPHIKIIKNGPYFVTGDVPLTEQKIVTDEEGTALQMEVTHEFPQTESYSLCRCGKSKNMPFCDGSHQKEHFDGTETAKKEFSGKKFIKVIILYFTISKYWLIKIYKQIILKCVIIIFY